MTNLWRRFQVGIVCLCFITAESFQISPSSPTVIRNSWLLVPRIRSNELSSKQRTKSNSLCPIRATTDQKEFDPSIVKRRSFITGGILSVFAPTVSSARNSDTAADQVVVRGNKSYLCDPTVSGWKKQDRVIHIVGTAHISSVSADLAGKVVSEIKPDCLFVELDVARIQRAFRGGRPIPGTKVAFWDTDGKFRVGVADPKKKSSSNPFLSFLTKAFGGGFSRVVQQEGFLAGEEFITSVEQAVKVGAVVVLGDRDYNTSMQRLAEASRKTDPRQFLEADQVMSELLKQQAPPESVGDLKEFIETVKTKEVVDRLMGIFRSCVPDIYTAMVKERDEYMSIGLNSLKPFQETVAVMGLAHVDGVTKNLESSGWRRMAKKQC